MTPRLHILSPDASVRIEGVCMENILRHLPRLVGGIEAADAVLVPVSYYGDYVFNPALLGVDKPVILMSFLEFYGQADDSMTHLLGINHTQAWPKCGNHEWQKLDDWCRSANVVLRFTRELRAADASDTIVPIEWPCYLPLWEREPKLNFDTRPFEWIFSWGMSNPVRPRLHAQTFDLMAQGRMDVISQWDHIDAKLNEPHRRVISIHTPHTHRIHVNEIARRQAQSKMSVSLPGAGTVCFRSTEHLLHTVPAKLKDGLAWSFPWVHGENCVILEDESRMAESLMTACALDLHPIYLAAQELASRYSILRYMNEYVMPHITRVL